jgi:hypothetical protein
MDSLFFLLRNKITAKNVKLTFLKLVKDNQHWTQVLLGRT